MTLNSWSASTSPVRGLQGVLPTPGLYDGDDQNQGFLYARQILPSVLHPTPHHRGFWPVEAVMAWTECRSNGKVRLQECSYQGSHAAISEAKMSLVTAG